MRTRFVVTTALLAVFVFCRWHFGSTDSAISLPIVNPAGTPAALQLGVEEPVGLLTAQQSGASIIYSDGNYRIQVAQTQSTARNIVRVVIQKTSGAAFRLDHFAIVARVPRAA